MAEADLRKFARGRQCLVRIPGVCLGTTDTVVLAHLRVANVAGVGQKPPDLIAVHSCARCHDALDGRTKFPGTKTEKAEYVLDALCRTLCLVSEHFTIKEKEDGK